MQIHQNVLKTFFKQNTDLHIDIHFDIVRLIMQKMLPQISGDLMQYTVIYKLYNIHSLNEILHFYISQKSLKNVIYTKITINYL